MPTAAGLPMPKGGMEGFSEGFGLGNELISNIIRNRYAGLRPSGDVANALYVEQLRLAYGDNDPRYLQAKQAHQMSLAARQSLMDYRGVLGETAPYRATSSLGKSIAEGQGRGALDIIQPKRTIGMQGETGAPLDNEDARAQSNEALRQKAQAYEQQIAKQTTDPDARKRYLFAKNVDITRSKINPQDLLAYSGLEGTGQFLLDNRRALMGKPPEKLIKHKQALTAANTLAKQVRQFYGDSIQPAMEQKLERLTNPATWYKNPEIALAEFQAFNDILDAETETYKKAGTSPIKLVTPEMMEPQEASAPQQQSDEDDFLNAVAASLADVNPNITPENIRHTAAQMNLPVNKVVDMLVKKYRSAPGG